MALLEGDNAGLIASDAGGEEDVVHLATLLQHNFQEIRYINLYLRRAKQPTCKLRMTLALHPVSAEQPAWYSG